MDTDAVLAMLQEVAEEVINPRFRTLADDDIESKSHPTDYVTIADRESEELITARLSSAHPDALVLGEEATADDDTLIERFRAAEHAFTVDPVDGTRNFVRGNPDHAVMVAEVRGGETVRGWIWQPQHGLGYVAERGAGAYRNGERLTRPPVGEALRGITARRSWIGRALGTLKELELTWVCCGVDYTKLVEGEADYAIYSKANPWDHAPGSLLLREAGGFVGTFDGEAYQPQAEPPFGLVSAADQATYELVQGLAPSLG